MKVIDCLVVGYNEISIRKTVSSLKKDSIDYKRLSLDFIRKDNVVYTVNDIYEKLCSDNEITADDKTLNWSEVFTAAVSYLSSYLIKKGLSVCYINDYQREKAELTKMLLNNTVESVVITTTLYPTYHAIVEIINLVRHVSKTTKVIVGGPFVYNCINGLSEKDLNNIFSIIGADYYICNMEGEQSLYQLLQAIRNNDTITSVKNVYTRQNGAYMCPKIEEENNLIEENLVDWSLFKNEKAKYFSIRLSTSCPFNCSFCSFSNQKFRYLTTSDVEQNLQQLQKNCPNKNIHFVDDAFNVPTKRFKEFLHMLKRNKFNFKWTGLLRMQFIDEEIVDLMKSTGCQSILLGVESGSQKILDLMNKKVKIEQYQEGLSLLNKYKINSKASFLFGFPGETPETIKETHDFIEENKPTYYYINIWYNDVLSPIYQRKDEFKIKGRGFEWQHNSMNYREAMGYIDKTILSIKNSIWLPLFNMDYLLPAHLLNKGLTDNEVKQFIYHFSEGVKEMIQNPQETEVSDSVIQNLRDVLISQHKDLIINKI